MSRLVYFALGTAGPHPYGAAHGIDSYSFHCGKVKHQSVIADTESRPAMAPTANSEGESFLTREIHCSRHVHRVCAVDNRSGITIDHSVINLTSDVVFTALRTNDSS